MSRPIILSEGRAEQVLCGKKTATRRLAKTGDSIVDGTLREASGKIVYKIGDSVAIIPGRGRPSVGRALITGVRLERLHDMSVRSANAECCRTEEEYYKLWDHIQRTVSARRRVWSRDNPMVRVIGLREVTQTDRGK